MMSGDFNFGDSNSNDGGPDFFLNLSADPTVPGGSSGGDGSASFFDLNPYTGSNGLDPVQAAPAEPSQPEVDGASGNSSNETAPAEDKDTTQSNDFSFGIDNGIDEADKLFDSLTPEPLQEHHQDKQTEVRKEEEEKEKEEEEKKEEKPIDSLDPTFIKDDNSTHTEDKEEEEQQT